MVLDITMMKPYFIDLSYDFRAKNRNSIFQT